VRDLRLAPQPRHFDQVPGWVLDEDVLSGRRIKANDTASMHLVSAAQMSATSSGRR
jgi:hypothetical protein